MGGIVYRLINWSKNSNETKAPATVHCVARSETLLPAGRAGEGSRFFQAYFLIFKTCAHAGQADMGRKTKATDWPISPLLACPSGAKALQLTPPPTNIASAPERDRLSYNPFHPKAPCWLASRSQRFEIRIIAPVHHFPSWLAQLESKVSKQCQPHSTLSKTCGQRSIFATLGLDGRLRERTFPRNLTTHFSRNSIRHGFRRT